MKLTEDIVIVAPQRTPFAQIGKGLAEYTSVELGQKVGEAVLKKAGLDRNKIDGVVVGEALPQDLNPARVISERLGLPHEATAVIASNNCVSGLEAAAEAARRISFGEGEIFLVIGQESQTHIPFIVKNARLNGKSNSVAKLAKVLPDDLPDGVEIRDSLEDGLGDRDVSVGMAVTAEILAQKFALKRETTDKVAYESFKRMSDAHKEGRYKNYVFAVDRKNEEPLAVDEAIELRKGLIENPDRMGRAQLLFENAAMKFDDFKTQYGKYLDKTHGPTVSIFNSSARSDGAGGFLMMKRAKAEELGLEIAGVLRGWKMVGVAPELMGLGQSRSAMPLMNELGLDFEDLDYIEIHEAFAATAVGALEEIRQETGFDWEPRFDAKKINPNGSSIAAGHPFGATGARLVINAVMDLAEDKSAQRVLITSCAGDGVGGSMIIERA